MIDQIVRRMAVLDVKDGDIVVLRVPDPDVARELAMDIARQVHRMLPSTTILILPEQFVIGTLQVREVVPAREGSPT